MLEWEFFRARCIRDGVWRHRKARESGNIRYNSHSKMIFPLLNSLFIFTTYLNVRQWYANKTFLRHYRKIEKVIARNSLKVHNPPAFVVSISHSIFFTVLSFRRCNNNSSIVCEILVCSAISSSLHKHDFSWVRDGDEG